jgi:hypothetical protein
MSGLTSASHQQVLKETFDSCMKDSMTQLFNSLKQEQQANQEKFGKELTQRFLNEVGDFMRLAQKSASKRLFNDVNNIKITTDDKNDGEEEEDLSFTHKLLLGNETVDLLDFHQLDQMARSMKEKHTTFMGHLLLSAQLYNLTDNDSVVVEFVLPDNSSVPTVDTILSRMKEAAGDYNGGGSLLLVIPSDSDSYYESDYFLLLKRDRSFQIISFQPMDNKDELLFNVVRATVMYFQRLKKPLPYETIDKWKQRCNIHTLSGEEALNDLGNSFVMCLSDYPSEEKWVHEVVKDVSPYFDGSSPITNEQTRFYAVATVVMAMVLEEVDSFECWLKNKAACENFWLFMEGSKYAESKPNMQAVIYFATIRLFICACKIVKKDFTVVSLAGLRLRRGKGYDTMEDVMVSDCCKNLTAALASVFDNYEDNEGAVIVGLHCCIKL